jgi:hypothetical protein
MGRHQGRCRVALREPSVCAAKSQQSRMTAAMEVIHTRICDTEKVFLLEAAAARDETRRTRLLARLARAAFCGRGVSRWRVPVPRGFPNIQMLSSRDSIHLLIRDKRFPWGRPSPHGLLTLQFCFRHSQAATAPSRNYGNFECIVDRYESAFRQLNKQILSDLGSILSSNKII